MVDAGALPADLYGPETARRLEQQAGRFGTRRLVTALEALSHAEKEMRWSDSGRVVLEVALARLMLPGAPMVASEPATTSAAAAAKPPDRVAERRPAAPPGAPVRPVERATADSVPQPVAREE